MSTVGVILSTVGDVQYRGGYHDARGGYHEYHQEKITRRVYLRLQLYL